MEKKIRRIGILGLVVVGISLAMSVQFNFESKKPLRGFRKPIFALELVNSPDEAADIVGESREDANRGIVAGSLKADFVFIGAYWLLFVAMSGLLAQRKFPRARALGMLAGVSVTAAAAFDVLENLRIMDLLKVDRSGMTQHMADRVRHASLVKWELLFVSLALLAIIFLWRRDWVLVIGVFFLLSTIISLVGLWHPPAIEWAAGPMGLGVFFTAVLFTFSPRAFLKGF